MKMKKATFTYLALFTVLLCCYGCATSNASKQDAKNSPVGAWEYTVKNTPNGNVSGTMNIKQDGEAYSGNLSTNSGSIDLNNVTIVDNQFSSNFNFQGTPLQFKGAFEGDSFAGTVDTGGQSFPVEAIRASE